ncbi:MAG: benzoyl-CoA-dihydrodiol lyase [Streptosporangiales bacterium]|nr:benzoyl-CoA-dihydrodiol lyase [Streptosporangiales bacterium]
MSITAEAQVSEAAAGPPVSFRTEPAQYRHWRLRVDGPVAWLSLDVDEAGGLRPGYELKLNSYDLGVDIELYDAVQRLRFEHPEVRAVVLTGGKEKVFCAGANIRMLAASPHAWKVNFCKFTNETRLAMEDATEHSGQTYIAALNGTASGGGYELALACDEILIVDDRSAAVSLPEVPLLGVLPGTGGLTRVVDKRHVRRDLADVFATKPEGVQATTALRWGLVDAAAPTSKFDALVRERAEAAAGDPRPGGPGVTLTPLTPEITEDRIAYEHVTAELDTDEGRVDVTVRGPAEPAPADMAEARERGASFWPLALTRELDDLILWLRTNEPELGTWVFRTEGAAEAVLAYDALLAEHAGTDWLADEIRHYFKRTLKRLDVTSRSLVALIEPGGCFAGSLLELALACDRQYMLIGLREEDEERELAPAELVVTEANLGPYPMGNGLTRLEARFFGHDDLLAAVRKAAGEPLDAERAEELGFVTLALDDIDYDDEVRIALEERTALSPDALTGMEANHRFTGPETVETKIFGRLTAWQNWIFMRPNAAGPKGALRRFGTGRRADYDRRRT